MGKVRVYQLAKELEVPSAVILELLDLLGRDVKSDLSTLDEGTAGEVRQHVSAALARERAKIESEQIEPAAAQTETDLIESPPSVSHEPGSGDATSPAEVAAAGEETSTGVEAPEVRAPAPDRGDETAARPDPEPAESGAPDSPPATPRTPAPPREPARAAKPAASTTKRPTPSAPAGGEPSPAIPVVRSNPTPPIAPGGKRPPRVFAAKRLPTKAMLRGPGKPAAGRAEVPGRAPGGRGAPGGRPGGRTFPPPGPGTIPGVGPGAGGKPGGKSRRARKKDKEREREQVIAPKVAKPKDLPPVPKEITLSEAVTVKELAEKLNRKSKDVIAKLIPLGVLATINQPLDPENAIKVAKEFGSDAKVISFEEEAQQAAEATLDGQSITEALPENVELPEVAGKKSAEISRPPVVTVMGHVDHGKTSLLDAVRKTNVVAGEHGGITQHIGAYQVEARGKRVTFLDTPGHEAFTLMRARGARVTDVVVLVVAADDGVKPQTLEAIDHAKAAGVPIVVAINKIDKPNSLPDRVKKQLADRDLLVEEYGGDVVAVEVSAKEGTGIDELLEMILLVTEIAELEANPTRPASGVVLEAKLDRARGVVATVLVQDGSLNVGDPFIAGSAFGKVRAMHNENGERVQSAGPSTPVEVIGLNGEPTAGDTFQAVSDESKARQIASFRQDKVREATLATSTRRVTLENLAEEVRKGEVKELAVLLKADVQGSVEALRGALGELPSDKVRVNILRTGTGAITQADVLLAAASNAIIVGFNVRPDRAASDLAKQEEVQVRQYTVIYDVIDEIKQAMLGMLEPTIKEVVLGQAEVRQLFKVPKVGVIAGSYVTDGRVTRNAEVRLIRDNVLIYTGRVSSLKRFKDDVSEVKNGYECGIGIEKYNDLKEGDVIEFFVKESVAAESL